MRISEMQEREDVARVFRETLEDAWTTQLARPVTLRWGERRGQAWRLHPVFSAFVAEGVSREARHFLRDSFRFSPRPWRQVPQALLGTALASSLGLRLTSQVAFSVAPAIPGARHCVVLPGNQRLRLFDFESGRSRVVLKRGFDAATMRTEIRVRARRGGPFPPILAHAADGESWFEEDIIEGYALPRCPPWLRRGRLAEIALAKLDTWLDESTTCVAAAEYLDARVQDIDAAIEGMSLRFPLPQPKYVYRGWGRRLAEVATSLGDIPTAETHGDCQPGNILVDRRGQTAMLIDWEHSERRFRHYDRLVFGLASRQSPGLAERVRCFLARGETSPALEELPKDAAWRRAAVALFLLEDLRWYARESLLGPYVSLPRGFASFTSELALLGDRLEDLDRR